VWTRQSQTLAGDAQLQDKRQQHKLQFIFSGQKLEKGPREAVGCPSMEILRDGLDKAPSNLI